MNLPRPALALLVLVTCIGCDRVTKHIAVDRLEPGERHSFLGDTVRLEYAENTGAFLGLGDSLPDGARFALLTVLTGILLLAVTWALVKRPLPGPRSHRHPRGKGRALGDHDQNLACL